MKPTRILAFLVGFLALGISIFVYLEYIHLLGFPDGFITELANAERRLARVFIGVSVGVASYCIYLASVVSRKKIARTLSVITILYLVFIIGLALLDYYYRQHLMGSAGG